MIKPDERRRFVQGLVGVEEQIARKPRRRISERKPFAVVDIVVLEHLQRSLSTPYQTAENLKSRCFMPSQNAYQKGDATVFLFQRRKKGDVDGRSGKKNTRWDLHAKWQSACENSVLALS